MQPVPDGQVPGGQHARHGETAVRRARQVGLEAEQDRFGQAGVHDSRRQCEAGEIGSLSTGKADSPAGHQGDVLQACHRRVHVARHREVADENLPVPGEVRRQDHWVGRVRGGDDNWAVS